MMNKPQGVIYSQLKIPTTRLCWTCWMIQLVQKKFFPVGRLDIDTHGLLLLTMMASWLNALLSPKRHVDKTYLAQVNGIMTDEDIETFSKGIPLKDFTCQPAKLELVSIDTERIKAWSE